MGSCLKNLGIGLVIGTWMTIGSAEEITPNEISTGELKALSQQVQDVKKDVLDISSSMVQIEEQVIYPPSSRTSFFLTVVPEDKSRLENVKIKIDGKDAVNHIYNPRELDALQRGGVQRIYTGNILDGEHKLEVSLIGKSAGDKAFQKNADYNFSKKTGPKIIEITLAGSRSGNQGISFRD